MVIPLEADGKTVGTVDIRREEKETCFFLRGTAKPDLYRVTIRGDRGTVFLGVWEGEQTLCRRLSRELTAPLGTPLCACAVRCQRDEGWVSAPPERFAPWPTEHGLCRRRGGVWELALPYRPDRPFPLPELVCLARICTVAGEERAVFCFDDDRMPVMPL